MPEHTPEEREALWASAEHWLENWQDLLSADSSASACPCCDIYLIAGHCDGCPIAAYTEMSGCNGTPWSDADTAITAYKRLHNGQYLKQFASMKQIADQTRSAIEAEYRFLVSLALGESPDISDWLDNA